MGDSMAQGSDKCICPSEHVQATRHTPSQYAKIQNGLIHELCFISTCSLNDSVGAMHARIMNNHNNGDPSSCGVGTGITLDGSDDYINLDAVPLGGEMTIAFWARWHSYSYETRLIVLENSPLYLGASANNGYIRAGI
jgi:hypothetical protein